MTRIVLLGRAGQVGWELERTLLGIGNVAAFDRATLDLCDTAALERAVVTAAPQFIINAAAYTNVDGAESAEDEAMRINAGAPAMLAACAKRLGAVLIHFSTDYVFDGRKPAPYLETDATAPLNAYGRSKLAGERAIIVSGCAHLIVRTSWVYAARGRNFLRTMLRLANERTELSVVDDQIGAPTWARFIAEATAQIVRRLIDVESPARGAADGNVLHLACAGATSWYGFASGIRAQAHALGVPFAANLRPIPAAAYPSKAVRPVNSQLDCGRLASDWGIEPPDWAECLRLCIEEVAAG